MRLLDSTLKRKNAISPDIVVDWGVVWCGVVEELEGRKGRDLLKMRSK